MLEDIELLKKKIVYKSSYRGIKELDIILRSFVSKYLNKLNFEELTDLFDFLDNNDEDIYKFIKKRYVINPFVLLYNNILLIFILIKH